MAYNILVIPCEISSLTIYFTKIAARNIPSIGIPRYQKFTELSVRPTTKFCTKCMNDFIKKAAIPANTPIIRLNMMMKVFSLTCR